MESISSVMFECHVRNRNNIIYPWSLSIVDCHFLMSAWLRSSGEEGGVHLSRWWDGDKRSEAIVLKDAYDLYDADTAAYGSEVAIVHEKSGSCCYWDLHERFVIAVGNDSFIATARPYPRDIEKHRYLEDMSFLRDVGLDPLDVYNALVVG